jgi:hypothetical protein
MAEPTSILGSFSVELFRESGAWLRLRDSLSKGGCYGISGQAGAGKSSLMRRAAVEARNLGGVGLHFSCPSDFNANSFMSAVTGALADEVSRRARERQIRDKNPAATTPPIIKRAQWRHLKHEAAKVRERIRFSANLTFASERGISGTRIVTAVLSQSRQRTLIERPATTAALVFDFHNFASDIIRSVTGPVVIGIDGLDQVDDPAVLLALLRDVAGILDMKRVTFLVSISDSAAAMFRSGLAESDQSKLAHPFTQLIEIPPLTPADARQLLAIRRMSYSGLFAEMLCLLSSGNEGDLLRMAEFCEAYVRSLAHSGSTADQTNATPPLDQFLARQILADEAEELLDDILRLPAAETSLALAERPSHRLARGRGLLRPARPGLTAAVKYRAMKQLPRADFADFDRFVSLGRQAMRDDMWEPQWSGPDWWQVQERWRRFLVRLFLTVAVLRPEDADECDLLDDGDIVIDLRNVVSMANVDVAVARLMLAERFGDDFSSPYRPAKD